MERKIIDVAAPDGQSYKADAAAGDCIRGVTVEELAAGFPPVHFVWSRRIPLGKVTVFAGAGAAGKSSILTGLAIARGYGAATFLGHPIMPGSTLFVSGEDVETDYWRRSTAWLSQVPEQHRDRVRQAVARNMKVMNLVGRDYKLVQGHYEYVVNEAAANGIALAAKSLNPVPSLIVVETVSRFGGDESNSAHSALVMACEGIAERTGAAVVLVSHRGKANVREQIDDAYSARGGSALIDNARSAIVLGHMPRDVKRQIELIGRPAAGEEKDLLILTAPKVNFCAMPGPIFLRRVSTPDGMVLKPYEPPAHVPEDTGRKLQGAQLRAAIVAIPGCKATARQIRNIIRTAPGVMPAVTERGLQAALSAAVADGYLGLSTQNQRGAAAYVPGPLGAAGVDVFRDTPPVKADLSGVAPMEVEE